MPPLLAGGAALTLNPRSIGHIADVVLCGEFEAFAGELMPVFATHPSRRECLDAFIGMKGAFVGGQEVIERRHADDLDRLRTETVIYSDDAAFGDLHLIEVERGCPRQCRFCATPEIYGAHRCRSFDAVIAMVEDGLPFRKRMGLIGADLLSHPAFESIAEKILARGATFSPSSVRADAVDDRRAALLAQAGHRSIALGVEAGSERLRRTLGKGLSDMRLLAAIESLARAGINRIRLYFMVGLPTETEEDVAAITALTCSARATLRGAAPQKHRATSVELTVTPFVPKPGTAFESASFAAPATLKHRFKILQRLLGREAGIMLRFDSLLNAQVEARMAAAGEDDGLAFLEEVQKRGLRAALGSRR
jgi:radical SAM superfamily enzyme YgiQ (UPF0313 family)